MAYKRERRTYNGNQHNAPDSGSDNQEQEQPRRRKQKANTNSAFIQLSRLFPAKSGKSYSVFLNEVTYNKIMTFMETAGDSDLIGVTINPETGLCSLWGRKGDES